MPYIEKELVSEFRNRIKKAYPGFKFSITRQNYSTVSVDILSGPIDFGTEYTQVNHYYIENHYEGEARKVLEGIKAILSGSLGESTWDSDYGYIPTYYIRINIGCWDKPYIVK